MRPAVRARGRASRSTWRAGNEARTTRSRVRAAYAPTPAPVDRPREQREQQVHLGLSPLAHRPPTEDARCGRSVRSRVHRRGLALGRRTALLRSRAKARPNIAVAAVFSSRPLTVIGIETSEHISEGSILLPSTGDDHDCARSSREQPTNGGGCFLSAFLHVQTGRSARRRLLDCGRENQGRRAETDRAPPPAVQRCPGRLRRGPGRVIEARHQIDGKERPRSALNRQYPSDPHGLSPLRARGRRLATGGGRKCPG